MNSLLRSSFAAALACAASMALAQAQKPATSTFSPEYGQPGKDVVWVPTSQAVVDRMLDLTRVTPADYVMDLGSGDGRTVITAARRGARAHGVEYNPDMVAMSQRNAEEAGVTARATFAKQDLFETDFSQATVITMFLLPSINLKLRPKLLALKPGTRIASNSFDMGDWAPDESSVVTSQEGCNTSWCNALLWIVPANFAGTHQALGGKLELVQTFQKLSGSLIVGLHAQQVESGRVRGEEAGFTIAGKAYRARLVDGKLVVNPS